ncbi:MAG: transglutaminase domain-containing protein, partial [Candidatus Hadarchaeales archaeon]
SSQCHWRSDGGIIWKARGDASDFANLYVSLCNSLGIPARRVHVVEEETTQPWSEDISTTPTKKTRYYEEAEVYLNNTWRRCNPIKGSGLGIFPIVIQDISLDNTTLTTTVYMYDSNGIEHQFGS